MTDYITRWAPPATNNTRAYIRYMCEMLPCKPDETIDIHVWNSRIIYYIVMYENGEMPYTANQVAKAILLSHSI